MLRHHRHTSVVVAAAALIAVVPKADGGGATPITSCGQTVTTNTVLIGDLDCSGSSGVIVGAAGITIDLKGFRLRGDRTSGHYGVDDGGGFANVRVRNGTVCNFASGVYANNADGFSVLGVVATGNLVSGIALQGASVSVKSSVATSNGAEGILLGGQSTSVKSSSAIGNGSDGINLSNGGSQTVTSSLAVGNTGIGIHVLANSNASIKGSTASGNGSHGIVITGTGGQIKSNHADGNGFVSPGLGIVAGSDTIGTNLARGNQDPAECDPASLCCTHTLCDSQCVNVAIDPANCGKCGHICPGLVCSGGVCLP
jgi:parallel beta-helix repeat protein